MNNNSLVSVIVPCYNQAQYLPETLQSVLDQTYMNWECLIVNDGSPDNTEEVALEWIKKDIRFKYLKKQNGGLADARNYGIKASSGEYILPLDSDDLIATTYIEKAAKKLKQNPEIGIVYCKAKLFGNQTGLWSIPKHTLKRGLTQNTIFCSALFRRNDFNKTHGYNSNMIFGYEDWDFWLSLIEHQIKVYRISESLFLYRVKEISMRSLINWERMIYLHKQIIQNHQTLYQEHFRNPYIIIKYLEFRMDFKGTMTKKINYILKNLNFKLCVFIFRYKLNLLFRLKVALLKCVSLSV
jgi:glycosyltransferase involved in cell wall biosynthesis